ncbi:MAG: DUF4351 domain-containing protein [Chloroflexota bacterium]
MSIINELTTPIDRVSKLLFKEYADVLLRLAFPGQTVSLLSVEENVEINLPTRPVDMVMMIALNVSEATQRQGLHVEYYARHVADVPQTLFIYSAELTDRLGLPVATLVIYSERRRPRQRPPAEYVVRVGNQVVNRFTYPAIWLMDYEAQIRSGELAPLAPFLLEIVARPTEETLETARQLALTEPEAERRGLLLSLVALLAARYFDKETIRKLFRREVEMIKTNTFIDDWLEEAEQRGIERGRQEGRQEGQQEGRQEGQQELMLRFLEFRFGLLPVHLVLQIKELTAAQFDRLFDLVLKAVSLEEVVEAIEAILMQQK